MTARTGRGRHLLWATMLTPLALLLALGGPSLARFDIVPLDFTFGQPLLAALGAAAGIGAVYHADGSEDELTSISDENYRVMLIGAAFLAIAVSAAWLWLGTMALLNWLLGS